MPRSLNFCFGLVMTLISATLSAESDFDFEELMNDVETRTQEMQNLISAGNVAQASEQAKHLQDAFVLVEGYFVKRGDAGDAVEGAKSYQAQAQTIQSALSAGNVGQAAAVASDFSKDCRGACHDKYKPL